MDNPKEVHERFARQRAPRRSGEAPEEWMKRTGQPSPGSMQTKEAEMNRQAFEAGFRTRLALLQKQAGFRENYVDPVWNAMAQYGAPALSALSGFAQNGLATAGAAYDVGTSGLERMRQAYLQRIALQAGIGPHHHSDGDHE